MELCGEIKGKTRHREVIKSPIVSIINRFAVDLIRNDVPVTLYYKHKNNPWKTMLINNVFNPEAVPHNSDVYLAASVASNDKIIYKIEY